VSASLARRALAEGVGTAALVTVVVGSGIQAAELSHDVGMQLLANSLATVFGLGVLIALLGPVSGAHLNPVVTLAAWIAGRADGDGPSGRDVAAYVPAQLVGAVGGAVVADAMFAEPLVAWSTHDRSAGHLWLGEVVATAGLVTLVLGLGRVGRAQPGTGGGGVLHRGRVLVHVFYVLRQPGGDRRAGVHGHVRRDSAVLRRPVRRRPTGRRSPRVGLGDGALRAPSQPLRTLPLPLSFGRHRHDCSRRPPVRPLPCPPSCSSASTTRAVPRWRRPSSPASPGDRVEVRSAGSVPADAVNPAVVEAMREVGIDISAETPKVLTVDAVRSSDVVITMGCGDTCPVFPGKRYLDWRLDDPAGQGVDAVRPIRDEIERRIRGLVGELTG
jgi:arsenate reductase